MTERLAKKVHMIGIGGAGMSGIAQVLKESGVEVSGSDLKASHVTSRLEGLGIKVFDGHKAENVATDVDTVVFSTAVPAHNPELEEARQRGLSILGRGQMLACLANCQKPIAIAGAHGKTTTTSMIATILQDCGFEPSFITGGELQINGQNACTGGGQHFVIEADESDGSFLQINPYIAVVTNVEDDHLDYYHTVENLQAAFEKFIGQVSEGGMAVVCGDDLFLSKIAGPDTIKTVRYGFTPGLDYTIQNWQPVGLGSHFDVYCGGQNIGQVRMAIPGRHNALNALAAIAVATELGADFSRVATSLSTFKGARRRFEVLLEQPVMVVDDYAHHPTEIQATMAAALQSSARRLIVAFQPHRYSRTQQLGCQFGAAFAGADKVVVSAIYPAGEQPIEGVSGSMIHESAVNNGIDSQYIADIQALEQFLISELKDGDMLLVMGAGDIWHTAVKMADYFGSK